jgi:uncharacterized protein YkwD
MHSFTEAATEAIAQVRAEFKERPYNGTEKMRVSLALDEVARQLADNMKSYSSAAPGDPADILRAAGCTEQVVEFYETTGY